MELNWWKHFERLGTNTILKSKVKAKLWSKALHWIIFFVSHIFTVYDHYEKDMFFKLLQEASISHLSVSSDTFVCWMSKKQFQLRWSVCRKTSQEEASISHFEFIISRQGCLSSTQNLSQNTGACQWLAKAVLTELWLWGELIFRLS